MLRAFLGILIFRFELRSQNCFWSVLARFYGRDGCPSRLSYEGDCSVSTVSMKPFQCSTIYKSLGPSPRPIDELGAASCSVVLELCGNQIEQEESASFHTTIKAALLRSLSEIRRACHNEEMTVSSVRSSQISKLG